MACRNFFAFYHHAEAVGGIKRASWQGEGSNPRRGFLPCGAPCPGDGSSMLVLFAVVAFGPLLDPYPVSSESGPPFGGRGVASVPVHMVLGRCDLDRTITNSEPPGALSGFPGLPGALGFAILLVVVGMVLTFEHVDVLGGREVEIAPAPEGPLLSEHGLPCIEGRMPGCCRIERAPSLASVSSLLGPACSRLSSLPRSR